MAQVQERDDRLVEAVYVVADEVEPAYTRERLYAVLELAFEAWAPDAVEREKARVEAEEEVRFRKS